MRKKNISRQFSITAIVILFSLQVSAYQIIEKNKRDCVLDLQQAHSTQPNVGMREVNEDVRDILAQDLLHHPHKMEDYLQKNKSDVVIGPEQTYFIFDGNHHDLALLRAGISQAYGNIQEDFSRLSWDQFWQEMNKREWIYNYDQDGNGPFDLTAMKAIGMLVQYRYRQLADLGDDPYRSLAGQVAKLKGFEKTNKPFMQFEWARFFKAKGIVIGASDTDFENAVKAALKVAKSNAAKNLPGYSGERD